MPYKHTDMLPGGPEVLRRDTERVVATEGSGSGSGGGFAIGSCDLSDIEGVCSVVRCGCLLAFGTVPYVHVQGAGWRSGKTDVVSGRVCAGVRPTGGSIGVINGFLQHVSRGAC